MADPILPQDLILDILSRLPVRSLCKFLSVCKSWKTLISDRYFLRLHRQRAENNPGLLLIRRLAQPRKTCTIEISGKDLGSGRLGFTLSITLPFNDFIDVLPSRWDVMCFAGENCFYVCNPSTQELVKLPEPSMCSSGDVTAGFGYVYERNEFILVHLFNRCFDYYDDIGCEVLRFSNGGIGNSKWKTVDGICRYEVRGWGVLVDNCFYWMIWNEYDHIGDEAIVSFDLEKEEFGTVSPPHGCFDRDESWVLVELRGFLCLVDNATRPFIMDIWALKDRENSVWVKKYSVDLKEFDHEILKSIIPLDYSDREILMDVKRESLDSYNIENKSIRRVDKLVEGGWTWLQLYIDSFFSLGSRQI